VWYMLLLNGCHHAHFSNHHALQCAPMTKGTW
jgi:hypothetical protein